VEEHSLKGTTNYGNRATGVGTKHLGLQVSRPMNSSALEFRDHGLDIITLAASIPIGGRALA